MKKIFFIAGFLFAAYGAWAQRADSVAVVEYNGPHLKFTTTEHNFWDVPHASKKIEYRFGFINDGKAPVVITKTLASCTCINITYDKKPVLPGEKGTVTVSYEVNKKDPGVFHKAIEIYSNSVDKRNVLIIRGNAIK